jgi:hypothetical protein
MRFMGAETSEGPVSAWSVGAVVLGEWHSMYEKPEHTAAIKSAKKPRPYTRHEGI